MSTKNFGWLNLLGYDGDSVVESFVKFVFMQTVGLEKALMDVGLSEKEAAVYLASLSLGPCRVAELAHRAGLKRTTVYSIVATMLADGLLTTELRGLQSLVAAVPPEALETVFNRKLNGFRSALPKLQALHNLKGGERAIRYYEGTAAVESLYEELLSGAKPDEYYYAMTDYDTWQSFDPKFLTGFVHRRSRRGLDLRILFCESKSAKEAARRPERAAEHIRYLPANTVLSTNLVVTPHCAMIHQLVPPILAIAMETRAFVQMHKETFELLWAANKPG